MGLRRMENGSKKEAMFEKMLEQKKEVKIVRRIVFVLALIIIIGGFLVAVQFINT